MMVSDSLGLPVPSPRILPFLANNALSYPYSDRDNCERERGKSTSQRRACHVRGIQVSCLARESEPRSHLFHVIWTTSFSMSSAALLQRLSDHRDLVPGQQGNR